MIINFKDYLGIEENARQIMPLPSYTSLMINKIQEKFLMNTSIPRILIITMPPRSLKTTIAARLFPMWVLECFPYKHVGLFSYSPEIVDCHIGRLPKALQCRMNNMNTNTQPPIDTFVVDDYCESDTEAINNKVSASIFREFEDIINIKLMDNAFVLIMASRWTKLDLVGRLLMCLKVNGMTFFIDYLNMPAISNQFDPFGRSPNESFHPEKYPLERLLELKKTIGDRWFNAMYQGMPTE